MRWSVVPLWDFALWWWQERFSLKWADNTETTVVLWSCPEIWTTWKNFRQHLPFEKLLPMESQLVEKLVLILVKLSQINLLSIAEIIKIETSNNYLRETLTILGGRYDRGPDLFFQNVEISTFAWCTCHLRWFLRTWIILKLCRYIRFDLWNEWDMRSFCDRFLCMKRFFIITRLRWQKLANLTVKSWEQKLCRLSYDFVGVLNYKFSDFQFSKSYQRH